MDFAAVVASAINAFESITDIVLITHVFYVPKTAVCPGIRHLL